MKVYPIRLTGLMLIPAENDEQAKEIANAIVGSMQHDLAKTIKKDNCRAIAARVALGSISEEMEAENSTLEKMLQQTEIPTA